MAQFGPQQFYEAQKESYLLSTNPEYLDLDIIHTFLTKSYWSPGVPRGVVKVALENSFCFGLYDQGKQIGLTRVVTDFARFAYLCDVFVLPAYRSQGLGTWMLDFVMSCPVLQGVRSFFLATQDAHGLYEKFGFHTIQDPQRLMLRLDEMPWYQPELIDND